MVEERYVDRSDESEARRAVVGGWASAASRPTPWPRIGPCWPTWPSATVSGAKRGKPRMSMPSDCAANARARLALNLLAADYGLAEFGAVELTPTENRRAVGRWRLLRRQLQATPEEPEEELKNRL